MTGTTDCIVWTGYIKSNGYGQDNNGRLAHRLAYQASKGEIPEGLEIDHLCRNRACVNPEHLEAVTHAENHRRMVASLTPKTHCINGHEYTPANTYVSPATSGSNRECRACIRGRVQAYRARKKHES